MSRKNKIDKEDNKNTKGSNILTKNKEKDLGRHTNEPVADAKEKLPGSNVSIPDEESVEIAKDWVDHYSKL